MGKREDLLDAAAASGGDPGPLFVCADWLEEHGEDSLAYAYRWCARRGRFPALTPGRRRCWWATLVRGQNKPVWPQQVPRAVWDALRPRKGPGEHHNHRNAGLAFAALADALRRLREAVALDPP
jgi:hypothetical protein